MTENKSENYISSEDQAKGGNPFRESFWRFLRPLPNEDKAPVVTGFGAIKKSMLPEHGGETLSSIKEKNSAVRKALEGKI